MSTKKDQIRRRTFDIIQIGNRQDIPSRAFDIFIVIVIVSNILAMFLETFDELASLRPLFQAVEVITVIVFCIEYALRIWTSRYLYPGLPPRKAVFKFLRSYDGVVDLLTILPFFFLSGFVVFRMLRVVRIFHLFRINTRYDSFSVIKHVLYEKRNQIGSSVFIIFVLMLASSLCMYSAEHEAQPEAFKNAFSGIWWSMSTLLTVGYGDIYPITLVGQIMAIVIALLGVGVVALPTGIISAGFVEQYTKMQQTTGLEAKMETVLIGPDSVWLGKSIYEIEEEYGVHIVMVKSGMEGFVPREDYVVKNKDSVVIYPR